MHMSKLKQLVRDAAIDSANLNADGSVNWDFVSSDIHIDTDEDSDRIDTAINQVADVIEGKRDSVLPIAKKPFFV